MVLAVHDGIPVLVKDVGRVVIGIAPRLGEFGYQNQDDAVEGVILLRTGEKTQDVLKRVEAKTKELNDADPAQGRQGSAVLRPQRLGRADHPDRGAQPAARHVAGRRGPDIFPLRLSRRADRRRPASRWRCCSRSSVSICKTPPPTCSPSARWILGSWWTARWSWWKTFSARSPRAKATALNVTEIIEDAAAEVDRPLFYAVAVIVAGFLPIYVLSGPSGTLFKPMADTMVFALVGSLIVTLTLLPVLCAWFMRNGVRERRNAAFEAIKSAYTKGLDFCLAHPWATTLASADLAGRFAAAHPAHRRRVHAATG